MEKFDTIKKKVQDIVEQNQKKCNVNSESSKSTRHRDDTDVIVRYDIIRSTVELQTENCENNMKATDKHTLNKESALVSNSSIKPNINVTNQNFAENAEINVEKNQNKANTNKEGFQKKV